MINTAGLLMDSWYDLLNGEVSVDYVPIPVYIEDAPESETGNYILLRFEGGTSVNNKHQFADEMVVITDIVTVFENNINRSLVEQIDNEINALVLPSMQTGLSDQTGMQILNVKRETFDYLLEDDGSKKYYRKVSRYVHHIYQK